MILSFSKLIKRFGERLVLNEVSFTVEKGSIFALCGASGSGKTTLVRIACGLTPFDNGILRIGESTIKADQEYPNGLYGRVGVVFQEYNLFPHLTALENVSLALRKTRRLTRSQARNRALAELEGAGLADKAGRHPSTLSGGERQRVAIARALAMDPLLLLLDEPISALDSHRVGEVLETIGGLARKGVTLLLVTHNLSFARRTADTFGVLSKGTCAVSCDPLVLDSVTSEAFV